MLKKYNGSQSGFAHPLHLIFMVLVLGVVGFAGYRVVHKNQATNITGFDFQACLKEHQQPGQDPHFANDACITLQDQYNAAHKQTQTTNSNGGPDLGNANSTDPVEKGKALSNGQCSGSGSRPLTHAPMAISDINNIQPMGLMVGAHVTPVDHEYYWGAQNSALNAYPVYADGDGDIVSVQKAKNGSYYNWWVTIAHSCTFLSNYNLITSVAPAIKAELSSSGSINDGKIAIKSGQLIGYVGHQSLDYQVWDTTKTLKGLLYRTAYDNGEPWKVNTVEPLEYFSPAVKAQILPKYMRTAAPRDGKIDYDVDGEAVGNWFLQGTNGYLGGDTPGNTNYWVGHLSLAYYYLDPGAEVFSIGNYQGQPTQFAIKNSVNWTKITPASGLVKVELGQQNPVTPSGQTWTGGFATGIKLKAGPTQATALLQMTGKETMKVEVFPGKTPAQVSGFDAKAKTYDRGQDAKMVASNTAT